MITMINRSTKRFFQTAESEGTDQREVKDSARSRAEWHQGALHCSSLVHVDFLFNLALILLNYSIYICRLIWLPC